MPYKIENVLKKFGLNVVPSKIWNDYQSRYTEIERERERLAEELESVRHEVAEAELVVQATDVASSVRALRTSLTEHVAALVEQVASVHTESDIARVQSIEYRNQLEVCERQRDTLSSSLDRSEARVKAVMRQCDRHIAESIFAREQLNSLDVSGRIQELCTENRILKIRLKDLESFIAEVHLNNGQS